MNLIYTKLKRLLVWIIVPLLISSCVGSNTYQIAAEPKYHSASQKEAPAPNHQEVPEKPGAL